MSTLIEDQLAMRELREGAYHEAGHLIILQRFGGHGAAAVWKNPSSTPDEKSWLASCVTYVSPEWVREQTHAVSLPPLPPLPNDWYLQFAAAGLIAEEILNGIGDSQRALVRVLTRIRRYDASDTDLEGMGIDDVKNFDFTMIERSIKEVYQYLLKEWPLVQHEAERLISEALGLTSPPQYAEGLIEMLRERSTQMKLNQSCGKLEK